MISRRGLFLTLLTLPLFLAVLIGGAIAAGYAQPPSEWVDIFHLNACELPCWIGIRPGETTLEQAEALVEGYFSDTTRYRLSKQRYGWFAQYQLESHPLGRTLNVIVQRYQESPTVQSITLWLDSGDGFPLVVDLINRFGRPLSAYEPAWDGPYGSLYFWGEAVYQFHVQGDCRDHQPTLRLVHLFITAPTASLQQMEWAKEPSLHRIRQITRPC